MPRKKAVEFEDDQEEEEALEWDKRKIIIAAVVILILIVGGIFTKKFILGDATAPQQSVQGISTQSSPDTSLLPSQEDLKKQVAALEAKASSLSLQDVASSSPQVQDILQQLKNLPSSPSSVVKAACINICNGL